MDIGKNCGTQTAALAFGGTTVPGADTTATEEYDGNSWTSVNPMNTARNGLAGAGIQTAGLALVVVLDLLQEQLKNTMAHLGHQ
jgi:hypothetical protein